MRVVNLRLTKQFFHCRYVLIIDLFAANNVKLLSRFTDRLWWGLACHTEKSAPVSTKNVILVFLSTINDGTYIFCRLSSQQQNNLVSRTRFKFTRLSILCSFVIEFEMVPTQFVGNLIPITRGCYDYENVHDFSLNFRLLTLMQRIVFWVFRTASQY